MQTPFQIFSASAGTGKTYRLTRTIIELLLKSAQKDFFRHILAITFTNKAVEEMKSRVLRSLYEFAGPEAEENTMFQALKASTGLSTEALQARSKEILRTILHNYSSLDIVTIDTFNHRLIQAFSSDLDLPPQFEVELDASGLLDSAIYALIERSAADVNLRKSLLDYVTTRITEEGSWKITGHLRGFGERIFGDEDSEALELLAGAGEWDLSDIRKKLSEHQDEARNARKAYARQAMGLIEEYGIQDAEFKMHSINFFRSMLEDRPSGTGFSEARNRDFPHGVGIFKKGMPALETDLPDRLGEFYLLMKDAYESEIRYTQSIRSLYPTLLLGSIYAEVRKLYAESQVIHISEFNKAISRTIRRQPATFLYEKLGERYLYYFIDEFQDTSVMQWQNLQPLIDYSLGNGELFPEGSGLFIVGDVKQSIYRWRGGRVGQFLGLIGEGSSRGPYTFDYPPVVQNLDTNYRSRQTLVDFVNDFFGYALNAYPSDFLERLFSSGIRQKANKKDGGYVRMATLSSEGDLYDNYAEGMAAALEEIRGKGYSLKDVGILVRNNENAEKLSAALKARSIPVSSVRGEKLSEYPVVRFFIQMLKFAINPEDTYAIGECLLLLSAKQDDPHLFVRRAMENPVGFLYDTYGFSSASSISNGLLAFYDDLQGVVPGHLMETGAASAFHARLREYLRKRGATPQGFLDLWERKQKDWFATHTGAVDAVNILTIHKAKGLEFPVVFLPLQESVKPETPRRWLKTPEGSPVEYLLYSLNEDLRKVNAEAEAIMQDEYESRRGDVFNLWYVALTRAEDALYVWLPPDSGKELSADAKAPQIGRIMAKFARNQGRDALNGGAVDWGELLPPLIPTPKRNIALPARPQPDVRYLPFVSRHRQETDASRRDERAEWGIAVHQYLSLLEGADGLGELKSRIQKEYPDAEKGQRLTRTIENVVNHPDLSPFFAKAGRVLNEIEILRHGQPVLRPDRLVLNGEKAWLLDYKTGSPVEAHAEQLSVYAKALEEMGYTVERAVVAYVGGEISTRNIR